jgi:hypothetical protein
MKTEQQEYIASIDQASDKEIFIKKTGWEEISLPEHSHNRHQIIYTLSGTLHIHTGTTPNSILHGFLKAWNMNYPVITARFH